MAPMAPPQQYYQQQPPMAYNNNGNGANFHHAYPPQQGYPQQQQQQQVQQQQQAPVEPERPVDAARQAFVDPNDPFKIYVPTAVRVTTSDGASTTAQRPPADAPIAPHQQSQQQQANGQAMYPPSSRDTPHGYGPR